MKKFLRILSSIGYVLCTYLLVSLFAAVFCFAGDTFEAFKNSDRMLITPENVEIIGNDRLSREDILFVAGLDKKISFFDADSKKMTLNLSTCGWVKKAFVEKFFPNSVVIHIEEFKPAMIVTSRKRSSDSDKDSFMPWFSDADGILFKKALSREIPKDMPTFYLKYSTPEEEKKRSEKIKNAIFLAKKWENLDSLCHLRSISYEFLAGYSLLCVLEKKRLETVIHLKEEATVDEWNQMMQKTSGAIRELLAKSQWVWEYDFDKVKNNFGETEFEIIFGKLVNIKKGESDG